MIMKSIFGIRGNRLFGAGLSWLIAVSYEAINLCFGSLAAFALADYAGWQLSTPLKLLIVAAIGVVTFTIGIYGHATILRLSPILTAVLALCCVLLAIYVLRHADLGYRPAQPLHGPALVATLFTGFAIIASAPLSWPTGADYSRYLPQDVPRRTVVRWVALGGFLPTALLAAVGVAAGTVIDMSDPQTNLRQILPSWFYAVFLAVVVLGSITNNVLTTYSSGLYLQGLGVKLRRSQSVFIDAVIGGAVTVYALFVAEDFLATLTKWLELSVVVLGPLVAVYAVDILLTRNRYDGRALNDDSRRSPYWYAGGVRIAGVAAMVIGSLAAGLSMHTVSFEGPIAAALDGADLSVILGPLLAAAVYAALARRRS